MNDFIVPISLDINCSKSPVIINSAQFDSGRFLEVTVTANGNPFDISDCTAVFKGKRSNKTSFAVDCNVLDNKVQINLDDAILSTSGLIASKVVLSDGTRTYSTQILIIDTDSSLDGDLTSDNNFSILNKLINQIHALNESGGILIDDELDEKSTNPLTNAKVTAELKVIATSIDTLLNESEKLSNKVSDRTHITDTEENYPSIEYLNGYYYNYNEIDDLLSDKLDSSSISTGTCELTPDTTTTAKSGTCTYAKIGNMVFINAKLTFNSPETAGTTNKYARFGNLPFATSNDYNSGSCSFLSNQSNAGSFYFRWNKIVASLNDSKKPADDETTNISFFYIINS